jgi:hypothetical protein
VAGNDNDIGYFHAPPPAAYFSTVTVTSSRGRSPYSFWPLMAATRDHRQPSRCRWARRRRDVPLASN